MGMIENVASPTAITSLLIKNLFTPILIYAEKSFINIGEKYKLLKILRYLFMTIYLFILRIIPSFLPSFYSKITTTHDHNLLIGNGDLGISRALSQLLSLVNDIPVSSRKYEVVRSLAERLIEENKNENIMVLHEVNKISLSVAFERTLSRLEAGLIEITGGELVGFGPVRYGFNRVLKAVRYVKEGNLGGLSGRGYDGVERIEEKLAAELLWLAQKLADCGCVKEAASRWALASKLGWLALSAEPRLQTSLVKVAAFLFKQTKDMGLDQETDETKKQSQIQSIKKMLMAWLPLLCRASSGTDVPVLSTNERAELVKILEELINMLEVEDDQEQVLLLWLHHYSYCPNSDWPNLHSSYNQWCFASRKLLILR